MKQHLVNYYRRLTATNILSNFFNLSSIQLSNLLLIMLIIPVIARVIGIAEYGAIMFASRFAQLAGTVVNYGTSQSGIRDTAFNLKDSKKLSIVFYNTIIIRTIIFALFIIAVVGIRWLDIPYYNYVLLAIPIVLAEVFNPICFFIGIEKLKLFNIYNLVSNVICIIALLLFIKGPKNAGWVNFILGMANVIPYLGLLVYFKSKYKIAFRIPLKNELSKISIENFYLTINGVSGNLQQSIIIFALVWGNSNLLGAYTLCDKIIGQCRNLLSTLGSAIYPGAVHIYKQSVLQWAAYRRKLKYLISALAFAGGIVIFLLADFIVYIVLKQHNADAIIILRIMAFVPVISSFNVFSILDILLKGNNVYLFNISIALFLLSTCLAFIAAYLGGYFLIGGFMIMIELCACGMYEFAVKQPTRQND